MKKFKLLGLLILVFGIFAAQGATEEEVPPLLDPAHYDEWPLQNLEEEILYIDEHDPAYDKMLQAINRKRQQQSTEIVLEQSVTGVAQNGMEEIKLSQDQIDALVTQYNPEENQILIIFNDGRAVVYNIDLFDNLIVLKNMIEYVFDKKFCILSAILKEEEDYDLFNFVVLLVNATRENIQELKLRLHKYDYDDLNKITRIMHKLYFNDVNNLGIELYIKNLLLEKLKFFLNKYSYNDLFEVYRLMVLYANFDKKEEIKAYVEDLLIEKFKINLKLINYSYDDLIGIYRLINVYANFDQKEELKLYIGNLILDKFYAMSPLDRLKVKEYEIPELILSCESVLEKEMPLKDCVYFSQFSANKKFLVVQQNGVLILIDIFRWQIKKKFYDVRNFAFNFDGSKLFVIVRNRYDDSKEGILYDVRSEEVIELKKCGLNDHIGFMDEIFDIQFTPHGRIKILFQKGKSIVLNEQDLSILEIKQNDVYEKYLFSPDKTQCICLRSNNTCQSIDPETLLPKEQLPILENIKEVCFSPDSKELIIVQGDRVKNKTIGKKLNPNLMCMAETLFVEDSIYFNPIHNVCCNSDGTMLAFLDSNYVCKVLFLPDTLKIDFLRGVINCGFSLDGSIVVVLENRIQKYRIKKRTLKDAIKEEQQAILVSMAENTHAVAEQDKFVVDELNQDNFFIDDLN